MRKRLAIIGHSEEGLALIPLLEANPEMEVSVILSDDAEATRSNLQRVDSEIAERYADRISADVDALWEIPGLHALIDADPAPSHRRLLREAPDRGLQVTTPLVAKLLYAFGPVDATRKPDLLQSLGEILESYNLTIDRRALLNRILQIAVGATGADRGSLMLIEPVHRHLYVEVAIGIERELIPKIRIQPGEGIAGRAFEDGQALLLRGKADQKRYRIVRERDDVESAISAPLIHDGEILGVLNLSHARQSGAFADEDLHFVEQLARIDAKIIARASEYHSLMRDSAKLRAQNDVQRILAEKEPLPRRLREICRLVSTELEHGICHLYLHDVELNQLTLHASSGSLDPLASPMRIDLDSGVHGWVARTRRAAVTSNEIGGTHVCFAVLPLVAQTHLLGLLSLEGTREGDQPEMLRHKITAVADALSAELWDSLREMRMERENTQIAAISEFSARMAAAEDSAELHRMITSSAAMILEAEHAILRLQETDSGRYQIRSYFGSADTEAQAALFAMEKEISIAAIQRKTPMRILDVETQAELRDHHTGVGSVICVPLLRGGRVVGTLSVLGKVAEDPMAGERFGTADQNILGRLVEQLQPVVDQVHERERSRHERRFDTLTGLPNATHLRERLQEELARSSSHGRILALVRLRVVGLAEMLQQQQGAEGDRVALSLAQEIRGGLREFDILGRTAEDTFEIVIPEPDGEVAALLGPIARRVREALRQEPDTSLEDRLKLDFGYALFPDEAQTPKALHELAKKSRITTD